MQRLSSRWLSFSVSDFLGEPLYYPRWNKKIYSSSLAGRTMMLPCQWQFTAPLNARKWRLHNVFPRGNVPWADKSSWLCGLTWLQRICLSDYEEYLQKHPRPNPTVQLWSLLLISSPVPHWSPILWLPTTLFSFERSWKNPSHFTLTLVCDSTYCMIIFFSRFLITMYLSASLINDSPWFTSLFYFFPHV